jgi:secreted trypsin-like serine protease
MYNFVHSKPIIGQNVVVAEEFEFPFIVFITVAPDRYYDPLGPFYCSGSLVTRRDVLASDHCLRNRVPEDLQVNIGSYDIRTSDIYRPEWWVTYETWAMHRNMQ